VLLSLGGFGGYESDCRNAGITACIAKPVDQTALYDGLRIALGSTTAGKHGTAPQPLRRRPRVLVVDDNEINQINAAAMLEKLNVDVDVASNGSRAIQACKRNAYDFVLMDCEMPEMDGFSATAEIRKSEAGTGKRLPIIAVTANAVRGEREKCLAAGMDDYLAKPVRFAQLREAIARWAAARTESTDTLLGLVSGEVSAIDFGVIDEIRQTSESLVDELLSRFKNEGEAGISSLKQAHLERDARMMSGLAHKLRGSCLALGVNAMAEICKELEQAGRLDDFDRSALLLSQVEREFERAQSELELAVQ
jgi:CheY-like chemotaxis protein/HPt (histidine-containing phosphotransfer) domain-containing protein